MKEAGAIVLAKSNMAEWAFTPYETVSSILPGYTKNPYALDRVTAGSSGGTAAAIAANFGAIGLGSDTGNSIRGPASHQALVGIRSTMGLTSRAGVVPLSLLADIAGPMTRTVADAVAVLQVIAGEDPADPFTVDGSPMESFRPGGRPATIPTYATALNRDALKGARIGVLRQAYERDTTDPEIVRVFTAAVDAMRQAGATIVDPAPVPLDDVRRSAGAGPCGGFKHDINQYLAGHADRIPVKSLADIIKSRRFHPTVQRRLEQAQEGSRERTVDPGVPGGSRVPPAGTKGGHDGDGYPTAGGIRLSDLEQPAAPDRRPEYPARRQQPVLLADHGLPLDPGADGIHARRTTPGRRDVLRTRLGRDDADWAGLCVRAADQAPPSAGGGAGAEVSAVRCHAASVITAPSGVARLRRARRHDDTTTTTSCCGHEGTFGHLPSALECEWSGHVINGSPPLAATSALRADVDRSEDREITSSFCDDLGCL